MKIKEAAERLNMTARAIRFYEEKGLIAPAKQDDNQYRRFSEKDIWRLQTIIALRESGMPLEDIKKALEQSDARDHEELQYYLELQRSVMFSKWLEIKQIIETTDYMIGMLKEHQSLPLDDIYALAEGSKRLREQRRDWKDLWNYDRLAGLHDQRVLTDAEEYRGYTEALATAVRWLAPIPGETGLDIGTGTGNLAARLIELGVKMAGVDQSKEMLKRCRRKNPGMETKLGNFLALPYLDGRFDFVVTSFAFHHLTDDQKALALAEMRRVLQPRGRICIVDRMVISDHASDSGQGKHYPSLPRLLQWLEDAGYVTKHGQIDGMVHIVYAVPIR
ncbi:MerR family transcriptional regulator [Paenibacillus caseinilyticus]|uniref:Transcriptional regulator n=1 Tax=Paenibacillus mucilaginosus K02 TaxID=997761 RepID=I0BHF3_9BACL|nr:MerR family transcriptional regulator [Paenibacillus mucilaginosus]AFH61800.1 transcriptional regulator [Paenibacillus mucilaginosus K02]